MNVVPQIRDKMSNRMRANHVLEGKRKCVCRAACSSGDKRGHLSRVVAVDASVAVAL